MLQHLADVKPQLFMTTKTLDMLQLAGAIKDLYPISGIIEKHLIFIALQTALYCEILPVSSMTQPVLGGLALISQAFI